MRSRHFYVCLSLILALACPACTRQNPDELREKTAEATAQMRRDAKAVAEGVKQGWGEGKTININKASKDQLLTLPGLTDRQADRIIAERPYDTSHQLVTRHLISQGEYQKVQDRITVGH